MSDSFVIYRTIPHPETRTIEVHVQLPNGMRAFTFPISFPNSTILAQIRLKLRTAETTAEVSKRRADPEDALEQRMRELCGKYEL
jgi:hypothetical protein